MTAILRLLRGARCSLLAACCSGEEPSPIICQTRRRPPRTRSCFARRAGVSADAHHALARDEEQVLEREFDGLLLARSNQEPCVSGANRV
jgi:hypothetical protein